MSKEIVLRNGIKILGTLPSGVGDNPLTVDNTTKEVGSIAPIDISSYVSNVLNDGYILIGNASNIATPVVVGGQILLSNTGIATIVADTIVDSQINSTAAISYSKLNLANSITDSDINVAANITRTKLGINSPYRIVVNNASGIMTDAAAITPARVLISDGNGLPVHSSTTAANLASLDTSTSLTTQLLNKLSFSGAITPTEGDLIYYTGGAWNRFPRGASGQYLSSTPSTIQWVSVPGGIPTGGTTGQYLNKIDGTDFNTQWSSLTLSKVTDVTASVAQVNVLATGFYDATSSIQTQLGSKLNNSLSPGALFFGNASSVPSQLSPATNGQVLTLVSGYPQWQTVTGTGTVTSIDVSGGSTGLSTSGGPVTTTGTITLAGTVNSTHGGTGLTSYTTGDILYASATNVLSKLAVGTNGDVLTLAAGIPSWAPAAAGSVTSVSGTAGRITSSGGATPVIDIDAAYVGQASIITLGTITTGVWNGTSLGVTYGGTGSNLSATGGAGQYLKQATLGGAITVGTIPASDITTGAALTRTNDTNVTLTLGGTPTSALLAATSITVSWSGTLAYSRFVNGAGLSITGRSANSAGVQADIIGTTDQILRVNGAGTSLGFGSIDLSKAATVGSSVLGIANGGTNSSTKIWWELAGTSTLTADATIDSTFKIGFGVTPTSKFHVQGAAAGTTSMIKFQNSTPTVLFDLLEDGRTTSTSSMSGGGLTGYVWNVTNTLTANTQTIGGFDFVTTLIPGAFTPWTSNVFRIRDTGTATDLYNILRNPSALVHSWTGSIYNFTNGSGQSIIRNSLGSLMIRGGTGAATTNLQFGITSSNQTDNMSVWNFTDSIYNNPNTIVTRTNTAILLDYTVSVSGSGVGGTVNHTFLKATPTFTMSGSTLNLVGIDWNPSVTATVGTHYGILIRPTSALNGFATATPVVTVDINGGIALRQQSPTQITANQNNYAIGAQTSFRLSSDASRNVTGLTGGVDGKIITIRNVGTQNIVFTHEDGASTAANRFFFSTAGNITLLPKGSITLQYDATDSRWFDLSVR